MFASFSTALSALNATSTAIDVVGNNLANLNTTGYKASTVSFYDLVTESAGGGLETAQIGLGTAPPLTSRQFTQGAVESSASPLDAAIQGDGFFVVRDAGSGNTLYTRAGNFQIDANGNLLTATGQRVEGWTAVNGTVQTNSPVGDLNVPVGQLRNPQASTQFALNMNLNSSAAAGSTDANFSTSIQVFDSLGNPQTLNVAFTKDPTKTGSWTYQVSIPGDATTKGTPGTPTPLLTTPGTITFDSNGNLTSPKSTDTVPIAVTGLSDGAADLNVNWNLYDPKTGVATVTQFAQPSAVSGNSQDGNPSAQLNHVAIGDAGVITAQYSDGSQLVLGQLALAQIRNPQSLVAVGQNDFQTSASTADPAIGTASSGGRGQILGSSLEGSTVDIATEFTNLIQFERSYQAAGKVVTTVDQMSQDTINLKQV
jgi:flagellar hook protein FlgE